MCVVTSSKWSLSEPGNSGINLATCSFVLLTCTVCYFSVRSETRITASLETVAGDACSRLSVSNRNVIGVGIEDPWLFTIASSGSTDIGNLIRSPELRDNSLLSSRLEFRASIHAGSTSPSKTMTGQIFGSV